MSPTGHLPVEPYFEDKEAGQRVDKVLSNLAASVERDISESVRGRTTSDAAASSLFFYSFERDIDEWLVPEPDDDDYEFSPFGRTGGRTLRSTGELHRAFPRGIPFDEERRYRLRGRFRRLSGAGTGAIYFGWQVLEGDAETVVATHWLGVNGQSLSALPAGSWQQYRAYVQGHSTFGSTNPSTQPDSPATVRQDATYFRPVFHVDAPEGVVVDIDYIAVEVVPEREEVDELLEKVADNPKGDVSVTINLGGGVADNMVSDGAIQTDAVRANHVRAGEIKATHVDADAIRAHHVRAGEIDADHISSISLSVLQAEVGVLSELAPGAGIIVSGRLESALNPSLRFIDLDASGSQAFISHDSFAVYADGTAIFEGELIAASGTFAGDLQAASGTFTGDLTIVSDGDGLVENSIIFRKEGLNRGFIETFIDVGLEGVRWRAVLGLGRVDVRTRFDGFSEFGQVRLEADELFLISPKALRFADMPTVAPFLVGSNPVEFLQVLVDGLPRYIPLHDDGTT